MPELSREDRHVLKVWAGIILSAFGVILTPLTIYNILFLIPALWCLGFGLFILISSD